MRAEEKKGFKTKAVKVKLEDVRISVFDIVSNHSEDLSFQTSTAAYGTVDRKNSRSKWLPSYW